MRARARPRSSSSSPTGSSAATAPTSTRGGRPWKTLPLDHLPYTRHEGLASGGPLWSSYGTDLRRSSLLHRGPKGSAEALPRALAGRESKHSKSYMLKVQAEGRRSELMFAMRRGDQFDEETDLPVSELRAKQGSLTWYEHSRAYVARKWALAPAKSRKNYADALATITPALVRTKAGMPDTKLMRRALYGRRTTGSAGTRPRQTTWPAPSPRSPSTPRRSLRWRTPRPYVWPWTRCPYG